MNSKGIFLLLFITVFSIKTIRAQDKTTNNYNEWLKTVQLETMIQAVAVQIDDEGTRLVLQPAVGITDLQQLATNWNYVREGLQEKGVDLHAMLWYKFATYTALPLQKVKVAIQSADTSVFSITISFDTTVQVVAVVNDVRGGDVTINYNFKNPPDLLSNSYQLRKPLPGLYTYLPSVKDFLLKSKHKPNTNVTVNILAQSQEFMMLEAVQVFGEATGKDYHERIRLTISMNRSAVMYWGAVACAGGIMRASEPEFVDATGEPDLKDNLRLYNQKIDQEFKKIFHEGIQ